MPRGYDHQSVEKAAQEKWAALGLYEADLSDTSKDPYYLLVEFPYPSGDLHIGHWYAYAMPDIYARFLRMQGKNVLFPIGFDAFGLPAENAAIKHGVDPAEWTEKNMERMRAQLRSIGTSFDWSREVAACDPAYYRWTQWLFLKLFEHGLATRKKAPVKWCPKDKTVLANEQVIDGRCERCGTEVEERELTQWFLKITQYADRLLADLDALPWREEIKDAQRAWIGKSEGAKLSFAIVQAVEADTADRDALPAAAIEVFTTRPDTLFGATYVVLAPEHPLVAEFMEHLENETDVAAYVALAQRKTERERSENKEKTGVRLEGIEAVNPANGERVPVYVADYVLGSYGTGAVMAVPAHDERDAAFAAAHGLPVKHVVAPEMGEHNPSEKHRPSVIVVVKNPRNGTLLKIRWGKEYGNRRLFVGGGIEKDEDIETAARREVLEETGYKNLKLVSIAGTVFNHYYSGAKNEHRVTEAVGVYFELIDDAQDGQKLDEHEKNKFTVEWTSIAESEKDTVDPAHFFYQQYFLNARIHTGSGILVDSGPFTGRNSEEAKWEMTETAGGERTTNYRLRDWLVSRQRYWGCPIPIVYDPEGNPKAVPPEHLPWLLPTDVDLASKDDGSPLATSQELRDRVTRIFGEGWTPECDTLDTFVDSSWYYLRYLDPKNENDFSNAALMKKWLPVDRYSGGSEHTTMHLLYSRFFYKALHDLALVPTPEPFGERFNRGIILGPDGQKMSKSKGNVVNPDDFVKEYGADAVRLYLAFIGPYNEPGSYPWNLDGVEAMRRFLERIAALAEESAEIVVPEEMQRALARAAAKVAADCERFKFNTAISALMILVRDLEKLSDAPKDAARDLVRLLAPFAPQLSEHLWEILGGTGSVHQASWPAYDAALLAEEEATVAVQVDGKRRGDARLAKDASEEEAVAAARAIPAVAAALGGQEPARTVYVPGRILNLVARKGGQTRGIDVNTSI